MTFLGFLVTFVCAYYVFTLPRQWAALPLLTAVTYMTAGQALDVGGLNFTEIRIMAVVGFLRVMTKKERIAGGWQTMDRWMAVWGVWVLCSGLFHKDVGSTLILRAAYVFDNVIIYFLFRIFVRSVEDLMRLCKTVIIMLAPLAFLMLWEKLKGHNAFSFLGGVPLDVTVREGKIRAQGPFAHPILAGTAGALCLPLVVGCWLRNRNIAVMGVVATGAMVYASASSGPIMTVFTILFAMALWWVRAYMSQIRWAALACLVVLSVVMKAPIYFLLAKINLTGSSTGWHRAQLIDAAIKHLGEWWMVGTDITRHWMPTGVHWNKDHTDITNHYILMGVYGGLPLMLLFMGVLFSGFTAVGQALRRCKDAPIQHRFLVWTTGAILFGHVITFLSVTYFDQTIVYLYFLLGAIGSFQATKLVDRATNSAPIKETPRTTQEYEQNFCHNC